LSAPAEQSTVCPLTSFRLASLTAQKPSGYITLAAYRFIRQASDVKKGALDSADQRSSSGKESY
jgi:hypothetical protein